MTTTADRVVPDELTLESLFGTLFAPEVWADPYRFYAELRAEAPFVRVADFTWVASAHGIIWELLRDPRVSSDERRATANAESGDHDSLFLGRELLLFMDPPDHTRLRKLVARAFTPRRVQLVAPRAQWLVDELLAELARRDRFDLITDFASPLATQIICELLGVPFSDRQRFAEWGAALARLIDPSVLRPPEDERRAAEAGEAFIEYFESLIAIRRAEPGDDLLSELIAAEEAGDQLDHEELLSVSLLLLVAGFETTVNLIGNGFVALMANRSELARMRDSRLHDQAVDELLRYDSAVQLTMRIATEPIEIAGRVVDEGDEVVLLLGAANRDPAVFADPDRLDVGRVDNPHVAFGGGIHHCLGAALARAEGRAAFAGLARWLPGAEIDDEPLRRPTFTLRGFSSLPVRCG